MSKQNPTAGMSTSGQPCFTSQRPYTKQGHRNRTVPFPEYGDLIFLRLPFGLPGPVTTTSPSTGNSSMTSGRPRRPYHPCVVYTVLNLPGSSEWQVSVFICRSFSSGDSEAWIKGMKPADREFMIPMEPSAQGATSLPPPEGFGPSATFEPGFKLTKKTWVIARSVVIKVQAGIAYKPSDGRLSTEEMQRLYNQHVKLSSVIPTSDVLPSEALTLPMGVPGAIYLGTIMYESDDDDDDDDEDPQDQEDDGMDLAELMEYLHNAAAKTSPYSAKMAKEYADTRREALENRVLGWMGTID